MFIQGVPWSAALGEQFSERFPTPSREPPPSPPPLSTKTLEAEAAAMERLLEDRSRLAFPVDRRSLPTSSSDATGEGRGWGCSWGMTGHTLEELRAANSDEGRAYIQKHSTPFGAIAAAFRNAFRSS